MWADDIVPIDRTLTATDIQVKFNVSYRLAISFLKTYGFQMGTHWAISEKYLNELNKEAERYFEHRRKK